MMTFTRAGLRRQGCLVAVLALTALGGPLLAGPFGAQGYATSSNNGYAAASNNSYAPSYGGVTVGGPAAVGIGSAGCASCGPVAMAVSGHPGHKVDCPPKYYHVFEGPPRMKFKEGCPRPVCDPCELPHFGYFQTCWSPWPYPADWRHCPYPTASDMLPPPSVPPFTPKVPAERPLELQQPYKAPGKQPVPPDEGGEFDVPEGKRPAKPKSPPNTEELPTPKLEKKSEVNHVAPSRHGVRLVGSSGQ